jgi:hypothetical protein
MVAARKSKAAASDAAHLREAEDAYFEGLSKAAEDRRRHESHDQRVERANKEQYARWSARQDLLEKNIAANFENTQKAARRRQRIVELWPQAVALHPANRSKRHDYIIEQLKKEGFHKSKKSGVTLENLVNRDLPYLRKHGRLNPPR